MPKKTERIHILMEPAEVQAIEDWMARQKPLVRSLGEAIRRLIDRGLAPDVASAPPAAMTAHVDDDIDSVVGIQPAPITKPAGGWPWLKLEHTTTAQISGDVPTRLKSQLEFLLGRKDGDKRTPRVQGKLLAELVRRYVEPRLRARGIDP